MKLNAAGLNLIKSFEGCRLAAYQDVFGVWTIGWGHAFDVGPKQRITQHQADVILVSDIEQAESEVARLCPHVNENQFAALVSLEFNTGKLGHFPKLLAAVRAGDVASAAREFADITNGGVAGLVRRRAAEQALFLTPAGA